MTVTGGDCTVSGVPELSVTCRQKLQVPGIVSGPVGIGAASVEGSQLKGDPRGEKPESSGPSCNHRQE